MRLAPQHLVRPPSPGRWSTAARSPKESNFAPQKLKVHFCGSEICSALQLQPEAEHLHVKSCNFDLGCFMIEHVKVTYIQLYFPRPGSWPDSLSTLRFALA
jgi:hypothetical protein